MADPVDINTLAETVQSLQQQLSSTNSLVANLKKQVKVQAATSTTTTTTTASGQTIYWLPNIVTVFTTGGSSPAIGWTQFTIPNVPIAAAGVILSYFGRRDSGTTGIANVYARSNPAGTTYKIWSSNSNGTDSDTEGYRAPWCPVPCQNGAFWYSQDAGIFYSEMLVLAYWK